MEKIFIDFNNYNGIILNKMSNSLTLNHENLLYLISCISDSINKNILKIMDNESLELANECTAIKTFLKPSDFQYNTYDCIKLIKKLKKEYISIIENPDIEYNHKLKIYKILDKYFDSLELNFILENSKSHNYKTSNNFKNILVIKNIENALNESEIKFKTLTEATSTFICILNKTKFLYVNPAAEKFTGYTFYELQNMNIEDLIHPDFWYIIYNCILNESNGELLPRVNEIKIITKKGEEKWINITSGTIKINGDNGILCSAFDITDKKTAEEKLLESEERYRKLIELLPDGIFILNEEKCLYANDSGAKMLGIKNIDDIVGKNLINYICPDYHNLFSNIIKYSLENFMIPGPLTEIKIKKADNTVIDTEVRSVSFIYNQNKAVLSIFRDITMRKAAIETKKLLNKALEHDKLVTEFFSNISHELRTPINVIISALQMCELMYNNGTLFSDIDKLKKYYNIMKQNCFRLIKLTNNILDITKFESGYIQLNMNNYDIVGIIEDTTLSVLEYIKNKGITLIFDTEIEEKIIACDADKIERIMLNLLSNAVKFTNPGGTITVKIKDKKDRIAVSVKDTGIGIADDKKEIIFERFVQADMSLSRPSEGSGIGLSIVKSLVELLGGSISLESELGKGSEFTFEIPAVLLPESSSTNETNACSSQSKIERINVEFSDIY